MVDQVHGGGSVAIIASNRLFGQPAKPTFATLTNCQLTGRAALEYNEFGFKLISNLSAGNTKGHIVSKVKERHLFATGKAKWLLENARQLSPEERALLLAVADLDVKSGRKLSAEEQAALDELAAQAEGYDPEEIEQAVQHMVEAKSKRKVVDWPSGIWRKAGSKK